MSQRKYKVKVGYRWLYSIVRRDSNGNRCDINKGGFRTKTEAKASEAKMRELLEYEKNNPVSKKDLTTVDELFDQLIKIRREKGTTEQTLHNYITSYSKWFKESIGSMKIKEVKKEYLQQIFDEITKKISTVSSQKTLLKAVFEVGVREEIIRINIVEDIIIKKGLLKENKKSRDIHIPSDEISKYYSELSIFLKRESNKRSSNKIIYERDMLMYHLLLFTGMRPGEAIALRWRDIDFNEQLISINKTQIYKHNKFVEGDKTKTEESNRTIPVSNNKLMSMFKDWKIKQEEIINKYGLILNDDLSDLIFYDIGELNRFKTSKYTDLLKTFYRHSPQISQITGHGFRHTFMTILIASGFSEKKADAYVGHKSNKTMADIYTHLNSIVYLREVANKIDEIMKDIIK